MEFKSSQPPKFFGFNGRFRTITPDSTASNLEQKLNSNSGAVIRDLNSEVYTEHQVQDWLFVACSTENPQHIDDILNTDGCTNSAISGLIMGQINLVTFKEEEDQAVFNLLTRPYFTENVSRTGHILADVIVSLLEAGENHDQINDLLKNKVFQIPGLLDQALLIASNKNYSEKPAIELHVLHELNRLVAQKNSSI